MRRLLLSALALPVADAAAQPSPEPSAARLAPSVVAHVGRDGAGLGIALPLNAEAVARLTLTADGERSRTSYLCALVAGWECPQGDVRTQRVAVAAAFLVRTPGWRGLRPYLGADVALRAEGQTENPGSAMDRWVVWPTQPVSGETHRTTRRRLALRPGLVGGLDVSMGSRIGVYAEGSVSAPGFPTEDLRWHLTERYSPFRAAAGLRVAW